MTTTDRFSRQQSLAPIDKLKDLKITVIGIGAIRRQVAIQLASVGAKQIQLINFDIVEPTNITTQGYFEEDLNRSKVEATADHIRRIDSDLKVLSIQDRYRPTITTATPCSVASIPSHPAPPSGEPSKTKPNSGAMEECSAKSSVSSPPPTHNPKPTTPQPCSLDLKFKPEPAPPNPPSTQPTSSPL